MFQLFLYDTGFQDVYTTISAQVLFLKKLFVNQHSSCQSSAHAHVPFSYCDITPSFHVFQSCAPSRGSGRRRSNIKFVQRAACSPIEDGWGFHGCVIQRCSRSRDQYNERSSEVFQCNMWCICRMWNSFGREVQKPTVVRPSWRSERMRMGTWIELLWACGFPAVWAAVFAFMSTLHPT